MVETIKVARDWIKNEIESKTWECLPKSMQASFQDKRAFSASKGMGVGWKTVLAFLGEGWKMK